MMQGPDKDPKVLPMAEALGKAVAERGWIVLTGGRSRGVMDSACKGAKVRDRRCTVFMVHLDRWQMP